MTERSIFIAALETEDAERAAFLDRACGGDERLRQRVELLLKSHRPADSFLERPPPGPGATVDEVRVSERPGTVIGPYKLKEQIGEGGMGLVFVAEQQEPVRRKVALKIIKPGMDSAQVVARFEAERQALAMMDHQNIAKVFDAGTTETGRPYFVMELVHGVPITEYCDANKLTPRQRLELFVPVCHAIQHAHQKGIIHRDVKPSNVLVTMYDDKPVPKVIDFGVAKAVEQRLTERSVYTQFGTMVGTFEYMSPEQAEMNAFGVDTRSDVYSLGVLLYELLTGTTPIERKRIRQAAFDEIRRLIKEEEPLRPSVRLSTSGALAKVAAARHTDPAKLSKLMRGELDWVVMRCLEKDRSRRYDAASALARDVQRYLTDEPVEACPPSAGYRLRKFVRKHRAGLALASTFIAMLLLLVVSSLWAAMRLQMEMAIAEDERRLAETQRDVATDARLAARKSAEAAQRVSNYLLHDVLAALGPVGASSRRISAEQILDRAAKSIGKAFPNDPEMEATARATLSSTYLNLGYHAAADREVRAALAIRKRVLGDDHPDTLTALSELAGVSCHLGLFTEGEAQARQALDRQRRVLGDDHPGTIWSLVRLAWALNGQKKPAEAAAINEEALRICRRRFGEDNQQTLHLRLGRADILRDLGRVDNALKEYRDVLQAQQRILGEEHRVTLWTAKALGETLRRRGEFDEAEKLIRKALTTSRRVYGSDHPWTIDLIRHLTWLLRDTRRLPEAAELAREVLEWQRRAKGEGDEKTIAQRFDLGLYLLETGKPAEAEAHFRQVAAARGKRLSASDPGVAGPLALLGVSLFFQGKHDEAEPTLREAIAASEKAPPAAVPFLSAQRAALGGCLLARKKYAEAEAMLHQAHEGIKAAQARQQAAGGFDGFWRKREAEVAGWLADLYEATGKKDEAARWRKARPAERKTQVAPRPRARPA